MDINDYNKKALEMAFNAGKKSLRESEEMWGICDHCGRKCLLEVNYVFNDGEWEQEGPALCFECQGK